MNYRTYAVQTPFPHHEKECLQITSENAEMKLGRVADIPASVAVGLSTCHLSTQISLSVYFA